MIPIRCVICEQPIAAPEREYRRVTGWEIRRDAGGTNAIRDRQQLEEWAHRHCVEALVKGRLGQFELFDTL